MIEVTLDLAPLRKLIDALPRQADRALRRTGDVVFERVLSAAGEHERSGALGRSLNNRFRPGVYEIEHDLQIAPHARWVHWGARPHVIRPKDKRALRWPQDGRFIFARKVRHPGYVGDPYLVRESDPRKVMDLFSVFFLKAVFER